MARKLHQAVLLAAAMSACCWHQVAHATFHEWRFDEIYSNASGTVQYIEFSNPSNGETFLKNNTVTSAGHVFTFPVDLPVGTPTAAQRLLLATPGYFALKGVPLADYDLGFNNFFDPTGDTLVFAGGLDTITLTSGQVPLDSLNALVRTSPVTNSPLSTAVNSPTNVAGTTGTFPRWENQDSRLDINNNGRVTSGDMAQVVSHLLKNGQHQLTAPAVGNSPPPFLDPNGDNFVKSSDASQVINRLLFPAGASPMIVASPAALVPEPSGIVLSLCGAGLLALVACVRRRI